VRDKTYDRLQQLTRALSVVQDENYRKWLEAEIMRELKYPSTRAKGF